jgi:hypothetical protein
MRRRPLATVPARASGSSTGTRSRTPQRALAAAWLLLSIAPVAAAVASAVDARDCPLMLGDTACSYADLLASAAAFSAPPHCDCNRAACTLLTISPDDVCVCDAGYEGATCDGDLNECASSPCGYYGARCAESTGAPATLVPCGDCHVLGMTQCKASGGCVPHGACPLAADAASDDASPPVRRTFNHTRNHTRSRRAASRFSPRTCCCVVLAAPSRCLCTRPGLRVRRNRQLRGKN